LKAPRSFTSVHIARICARMDRSDDVTAASMNDKTGDGQQHGRDPLSHTWTACRPRIISFLVLAGLALAGTSAAEAQGLSPADAQVLKVFGVLPWSGLAAPEPVFYAGGSSCNYNMFTPIPTTVYAAAEDCIISWEYGIGPWFRTDLGLDSTGWLPPTGKSLAIINASISVTIPRCFPSSSTTVVCASYWVPVQAAIQITPSTLSKAMSGQPYSTTFAATGGSGTGYTWSLGSGSLPSGFTLSAAGVLSTTGNPTATAQTYTFTVKVTDSASNSATQALTLAVVQTEIQITPTTLSKATSGQPYSTTFTATGGSGTGYTWSLASGTLPSGITLTEGGVLSTGGTPAATAQTYTFTVKVTDSVTVQVVEAVFSNDGADWALRCDRIAALR
jgi:hypothetical protein